MARRAFVELCQTADDWIELREIFTRSFKKYPLFEYIIPNEEKRFEFVRRFFDANYKVHTEDGSALPLLIRKLSGPQTGNDLPSLMRQKHTENWTKTVGGVLFIEPAKDGIGWASNPNDVYVNSYLQHGLQDIDAEAFERLKTYEEWETDNVTDYLFGLKIPLWNGMLCAIKPKYAGNGIGSEAFSECMKYIGRRHSDLKNTNSSIHNTAEESKRIGTISKSFVYRKSTDDYNSFDNLTTKILRNLSLITHHPHHAYSFNAASYEKPPTPRRRVRHKSPKKLCTSSDTKQQLLALSHCPSAVRFHMKNGFQCIKKIPYQPPGQPEPVFYVHVLMTEVEKYLTK